MWVDYDVPNRFLTTKNFYRSSFSKWCHEKKERRKIIIIIITRYMYDYNLTIMESPKPATDNRFTK
jgi:hypothetical protein